MKKPVKVKIVLNGREVEANFGESVAEVAERLGLNPKRCVSEVDGKAFGYSKFSEIKIRGGERVEIMKIVAGG